MDSTLKAYKGMGMEGGVARWYDKTTRKDMPAIKELAARIAAPSALHRHGARGSAGTGLSLHRTGQARIAGARR